MAGLFCPNCHAYIPPILASVEMGLITAKDEKKDHLQAEIDALNVDRKLLLETINEKADEIDRLRAVISGKADEHAVLRSGFTRLSEALETISAQGSNKPGSTNRVDCMAEIARVALCGLND